MNKPKPITKKNHTQPPPAGAFKTVESFKTYLEGYNDAVKHCQEELLKHLFPMVHKNGYPSEAVPKGTILELDKLMKFKS